MSETRDRDLVMVGIGASAGGLEALREFVQALPTDTGMCFVVVQHLAPEHPSVIDQLLATHAKVPVCKIEEGMEARPDVVYVIPAGPELTFGNGRFHLHHEPRSHGVRTPIDRFFQSIALEAGNRAYCVVLSGTGSDGTEGLRAVKAAGGVAIAQESRTARFSGMPENAAATGLVDFVLKPGNIPARLIEIESHRSDLDSVARADQRQQSITDALPRILDILGRENGHNFSDYKPGTLVRRIERRMTILRHRTVEGLIATLEDDEDERSRLLQDFLIGVTRFFRDEEAFRELSEKAIRTLLETNPDRLRIWVPGCSTGEEVYSIGMLVTEELERQGMQIPVKIFGTDIDMNALSRAGVGRYPRSALDQMDLAQRKRFFVEDSEFAQIVPVLREMCVFAPHNLIVDPPFSRLDLISCRNVLIYLNSEIQHALIPQFHYALNPSGFLFLGPSETLGRRDDYFDPVDKEKRIFVRNDDVRAGYSSLDHFDSDRMRKRKLGHRGVGSSVLVPDNPAELSLEMQIEQFILRRHSPPHAVVNDRNQVTFISENMGEFISPIKGTPSALLDAFLVRELRLPVRTAVQAARNRNAEAVEQNIIVTLGEKKHVVDVIATPAPFSESSIVVTLNRVRIQSGESLSESAHARLDSTEELLDRELTMTRRQLEAALNEHEVTDQELRSSNEELLSMNEELQSANEELETSREELQSINEELETINAELSENNRQLIRANSDLKNVFESTEIATLFLDSQLCVRRFTPETSRLFGVKDRDIGRPMEDLSSHIPYEVLSKDALQVMETLKLVEQEITIERTDETYIMRTRPYRTVDDRIDGCVVSFIDITERKRSEVALQESEQRYRSVIEAHTEMLCRFYDDGTLILINQAYASMFKHSAEELIGQNFWPFIAQEDRDDLKKMLASLTHECPSRKVENQIIDADGNVIWTEWVNTLVSEPGALRREYQSIGRDITESKLSDIAMEESESRFRETFESTAVGMAHVAPDGYWLRANQRLCNLLGYSHEELLELTIWDITHPDDREMSKKRMQSVLAGEMDSYHVEKRYLRADGVIIWVDLTVSCVRDDAGKFQHFITAVHDISDHNKALKLLAASEERKTLLMQELQHRVKNTLATVLAIIRFSGRTARDKAELVSSLQKRLGAISRTHDILTDQDWSGGRLRSLIAREISAGGADDRFEITGDDVELGPKMALSLSLAIHELTTNAMKYGALSNEVGQVHVDARLMPNNRLRLEWSEIDGPPIEDAESLRAGFGSFLLEQILSRDLDGTTELRLEPKGAICVIECELTPVKQRLDGIQGSGS